MRVNLPNASPGAGSSGLGRGGQGGAVARLPPGTPFPVVLFGKRPPVRLSSKSKPGLARTLRKMAALKDEIAELAGAPGDALTLGLCEGENACISQEGEILLGAELLERYGDDDDMMVAVLGHEIGHRPWTWPAAAPAGLNPAEVARLSRIEEAKADAFAGRVMADLDARPEAICRYLLAKGAFEPTGLAAYEPPEDRAARISAAFERRARQLKDGRAALGLRGVSRPLR